MFLLCSSYGDLYCVYCGNSRQDPPIYPAVCAGSKPPPRKAARKSHTVLSESDDDSEDGGGKATRMEADSASESGSEFGPANAESESDSDEVRLERYPH